MHWDFTVATINLGAFRNAFGVTLLISASSIAFGTLLGTFLGLSSVAPLAFLRAFARVVVELFLALPVLVVLVWIYFSVPLFVRGLVLSGFSAAVVGLSLSLSAFVAEIIRA